MRCGGCIMWGSCGEGDGESLGADADTHLAGRVTQHTLQHASLPSTHGLNSNLKDVEFFVRAQSGSQAATQKHGQFGSHIAYPTQALEMTAVNTDGLTIVAK